MAASKKKLGWHIPNMSRVRIFLSDGIQNKYHVCERNDFTFSVNKGKNKISLFQNIGFLQHGHNQLSIICIGQFRHPMEMEKSFLNALLQ